MSLKLFFWQQNLLFWNINCITWGSRKNLLGTTHIPWLAESLTCPQSQRLGISVTHFYCPCLCLTKGGKDSLLLRICAFSLGLPGSFMITSIVWSLHPWWHLESPVVKQMLRASVDWLQGVILLPILVYDGSDEVKDSNPTILGRKVLPSLDALIPRPALCYSWAVAIRCLCSSWSSHWLRTGCFQRFRCRHWP